MSGRRAFSTCLVSLVAMVFLVSPATGNGVADPDAIVSRMRRFLDIQLCTNPDHLEENLQNINYAGCGSNCREVSDMYSYLGGLVYACWNGMPYAYGRGDTPDDDVQALIDHGRALGNHQCHYLCRGCGYPGCDWSVGVDCSAAVCYAMGVPRVGTYALDTDDLGVPCDLSALQPGCYLVKPGHHVVLVSSVIPARIMEATGVHPVTRETSLTDINELLDTGYVARTPIAVAEAQGSDGFLTAVDHGGTVHLVWHVDSAGGARWYEFQYYDATGGWWRTFAECDAEGHGDYTADCTLPEAATLIFRVRENTWDGRRIPHGETRVRRRRRAS